MDDHVDTLASYDSCQHVQHGFGWQRGKAMAKDTEKADNRDVDHLASQVIDVLCERQSDAVPGARKFVFDYLLRSVTRQEDFKPALLLAELRGHRLHPDAIIDTYVPLVAQELGELWIQDKLNFAHVTIASMRLQSLLSEASAEVIPFPRRVRSSAPEPSALVIVPLGEQHFLGASVLSAQLRRMGVSARVSFGETDTDVLTRIEMDQPDMVLFSAARPEALEVICRIVKKIKRAAMPSPVLAIGGALRGDEASVRELAGVDLVTSIAKEVVAFSAKRVRALNEE